MDDTLFWIVLVTWLVICFIILVGASLDNDKEKEEPPVSKKAHYLTMLNMELTGKVNTLRTSYQKLYDENSALKYKYNKLVRKSNRHLRRRRS